MPVPDNCQYADLVLSTTSSTTPTSTHLSGAIALALAAAPQATRPIYQNGGVNWRATVRLYAIEIRIRAVGSQSNALVPADLYNIARTVVFETNESSSVTPSNPLVSCDGPLNFLDTDYIHYDQIFQLETQAFDSGNFNVPENWIDTYVIPINRTMKFFSPVAAGTSGWVTKDKAFWYTHVSDSSVTPHPSISTTARLYFNYVESNTR